MNKKIKHEEKYQQFTMAVEGDEDAELAYATPTADIMDFTHTYVPKSARGEGLANELIEEGLQYAAANNRKVVATCPAVATYIERHKEYQKLLAQR